MTNKTALKRLKLDPYFSKTIETNLNVWSHDQNSYEIKFEFYDQQCDKPIDLTGADMRILLDHAGSQPKIYPLEIESKVLGLAKFIMPEQIRGCEGKFTAHIYADYPNKTHDFGSFTFYTQLSKIDKSMDGCLDTVYVSEFEKALEKFKEIEDKIERNDLVTQTDLKEQTHTKNYIDENLKYLSKRNEQLGLEKADHNYVERELELKANKREVHSKSEVNALIDSKADKKTTVTKTEMEDSLALKIDKGTMFSRHDLDTSTNDKRLGLQNLSQEVHNAMSGKTPVNPDIPVNSITNDKLADSIITSNKIKDFEIDENKMSYIKTSLNRFNFRKRQLNGFHNYSHGRWENNNNYDTSSKIKCLPGQKWTSKYTRFVCYFDAQGNFIPGGFATGAKDTLETFVIPEKAYQFEVTCLKENIAKQQIEKNDTLSEYNEYQIQIPDLKTNINPYFDIEKQSLTLDKLDFVEMGKNLFNIDNVKNGYYVNPTTGLLNEASNYVTSNKIITYGKALTLQKVRFYALYTKEGVYLKGGTNTSEDINITIEESALHGFIKVSPYPNREAVTQVEYGTEATDFEPYKAILKGITQSNENEMNTMINIPNEIYATKGEELKIYKQNVTLDKDLDFRWGRGFQGEHVYKETFTDTNDKFLSVELYDKGNLLSSKSIKINVADKTNAKVKAMLLGDSTVDSITTEPPSQARLGYHMLQLFGNNLELIGTRGLGESKHEGRGGWTARDYRSNKTDVTGTNPFYNPETKDFDFSYYINKNNSGIPEFVFIQLGINDLFNYSSDEAVLTKIESFAKDIVFIKDSIKSFSNNIKVVYNIAIPPTEKIDVFADVYKDIYNLPQWRYKRNNHILANKMINVFEKDKTLILNPINLHIDVSNNIRDGVHPDDNGYKEIAKTCVNALNNIS